MENMNIYTKLQKMRVALQNKGLTKSGYNEHKKFNYFELEDFLPQINEVQEEHNTITLFDMDKERAWIDLINCENIEQKLRFSIPIADISIQGANTIQNIGGLTTYCRRYLYMIAFEIAEADEFDPEAGKKPEGEPEPPVILVDAVKIKVLKDKMQKKGVEDKKILDRYNASCFEELTVVDFMKACAGLEKMPDVESKQVDLGL